MLGPFDNVGWGPFALPGERRRLRRAEQRRMAEMAEEKQLEEALPIKVVGMGRANSRRRRREEELVKQAWNNAGKQLDLAESFEKPKGLTFEETKKYVADLREKFFNEKHMWRGEHIAYESAYIKGMERTIELMEKGIRGAQ